MLRERMGRVAQDPDTEIGRFIWPRAQALGLNKAQLAARLDVSWSTVQAWFSSKKNAVPELQMLDRIGTVLGLSAAERGEMQAIALGARQVTGQAPYATKDPPPSLVVRERTVERPARYNNLAVALKRMAEAGEVVPPEAAAEVEENVRLLSEEDPPVATWTTFVRDHVRRRKALQDATQAEIRKALGGVAVQEGDLAKPRVRRRS